MINKIKNYALMLVLPLMMVAPLALPSAASAAEGPAIGACTNTGSDADKVTSIQHSVNQGLNSATSNGTVCDDTYGEGGPSTVQSVASTIVNILSVIVGVVAVIMIIFGGFRYITSGGDSGSVSSAKNTLIYAIVGLIIVALAQFIVHFVLVNIT